MPSRKPPSTRNPEYVVARINRSIQSMVPGTAGGRISSSALISGNGITEVLSGESLGTTGAGVVQWYSGIGPPFNSLGESIIQGASIGSKYEDMTTGDVYTLS